MLHSISSDSSLSCDCCRICCLRIQHSITRHARAVAVGSQVAVKTVCLLFMIYCGYIALTGRGVVSILQGIVGVMFAVEGFWGAVKYDQITIKRFLWFLLFYIVSSIVIAIINLETLESFCGSAENYSDYVGCLDTARLNAYLTLVFAIAIVPIFGLIVMFFYRQILVTSDSHRHRRVRQTIFVNE